MMQERISERTTAYHLGTGAKKTYYWGSRGREEGKQRVWVFLVHPNTGRETGYQEKTNL